MQENDRKMNEEKERVGRKRKQDQITVAPASDDLAYSGNRVSFSCVD